MSSVSQSIPVERLWELYDYDPINGVLVGRKYKKPVAGTKSKTQLSLDISWNGKRICTNYGRVVFAWCTGAWPTQTVDHINRKWTDNRIQNLRNADDLLQAQNKKGFNGGATFCKQTGKWRAQITVSGKFVHLGRFSSKAEAQAAYQTALNALS